MPHISESVDNTTPSGRNEQSGTASDAIEKKIPVADVEQVNSKSPLNSPMRDTQVTNAKRSLNSQTVDTDEPDPYSNPQISLGINEEHNVADKRSASPEASHGVDAKKAKSEKTDLSVSNSQTELESEDFAASVDVARRGDSPAPVEASEIGITRFNDYDVLSGRGGGTNVHPGNRNFRDLINLHRRAYLKARKNDKPAISRAIVRSVREHNGRFLKKEEKNGLWVEIGDEAAREKTSQALRQRAPEMRKLLFDTEREEARVAVEEHVRVNQVLLNSGPMLVPPAGFTQNGYTQGMLSQGVMPQGVLPQGMLPQTALPQGVMPQTMQMYPGVQPMFFHNPLFYQAFAQMNKNSLPAGNASATSAVQNGQDPYSQMFSAALFGQGTQQFNREGA